MVNRSRRSAGRLGQWSIIAALVAVGLMPMAASAATDPGEDAGEAQRAKEKDWAIDFTPYVWVVNINGKIAGGPIDNTFGAGIVEILENLNGMAMADLGLRYKRVGLIADGIWSRIKVSDTLPGTIGTYDLDMQLDMALGTGAVFYRFKPMKGLSLDPYVGARWWRMNTDLSLVNDGGPLPPFSGQSVTTWADPVFGLRIGYDITEKWRLKLVGDVGGGVSKVSWQAMMGGGYQFTPWFELESVYRVLGVDYDKDGGQFELKLNGILFGFKFHY